MSKLYTFWWLIRKMKYPIAIFLILFVNAVPGDNGWLARKERKAHIEQIKREIDILQAQYEEDTRRYKALDTHKELERVAREKYFMKRRGEEVFVLVEPYTGTDHLPDSTELIPREL